MLPAVSAPCRIVSSAFSLLFAFPRVCVSWKYLHHNILRSRFYSSA